MPLGNDSDMSMKELKIGMIGGGFFSQIVHLPAFSAIEGVRVVALAEPHDELRAAVADRYRIERPTAAYEDLLADPDIDAVVVSMPRLAQAGIVADALAAKPAVLSEKPIAMTAEEARNLAGIAARNDRIWAVGYMKRYDAGVLKFRDLLHEARGDGRWGALLDVSMRDFCRTYGMPIPPHVRRGSPRPVRYDQGAVAPDFVGADRRADYEYTSNVASHDINLLRFLFGNAIRARSLRIRPTSLQVATFDADGFGITLAFGPADTGHWDQRLEVTFERARLTLSLPSPLARQDCATVHVNEAGRQQELFIPPSDRVWAFEAQARAFSDAARGGAALANDGGDCLADVVLIEDLWKNVDWLP